MSGSSLPDATQNPRFTGLRSFMRLPGAAEDKHPDVAIVGAGVAGLTAALTAADAGASVLVAGSAVFLDPDGVSAALAKFRSAIA